VGGTVDEGGLKNKINMTTGVFRSFCP